MNTTHKYRVRATSTTVRSGSVAVEGIDPPISFSAPPEFQGLAGRWTPEHFFVAAVAGCFLSTFSGMAFNSRFEFDSLELDSEGILVEDSEGWRFSEVVLRPRLSIAQSEGKERGNRLLHKAAKNCLVGRSIACPIVLESPVIVEEQLAMKA